MVSTISKFQDGVFFLTSPTLHRICVCHFTHNKTQNMIQLLVAKAPYVREKFVGEDVDHNSTLNAMRMANWNLHVPETRISKSSLHYFALTLSLQFLGVTFINELVHIIYTTLYTLYHRTAITLSQCSDLTATKLD